MTTAVTSSRAAAFPWVPILMYHRVVPHITEADPYQLCTTVSEFEAQTRFLHERGYKSVTLEALAEQWSGGGLQTAKQVVITFDDGYLDVFNNAFPILQRYNLTATIFLVAGYLEGSNAWDQGKGENLPLLGAREIREMQDYGISFGSHGRTHRPLGEIGAHEAWEEIAGSRAEIERAVGAPAKTLCYPYGSSNAQIRAMAQQAGYVAACGIDRPKHLLYDLSRINAASCRGTGFLWRLKMSGLHHHVRTSSGARWLRQRYPSKTATASSC